MPIVCLKKLPVLPPIEEKHHEMPKIVVIGEVLYDLFAQTGKSLVETAHFTPKKGGAPANLAVSAAKLGANVSFIGKVGVDEFGHHLKAFMHDQGVDVRYLGQDTHLPTMIGVVALPTPDTPQFILIPGATAALIKDDIPTTLIEQSKLFAFGGVNLAWSCADATFYGAQIAREKGKMVVFDVNYRPATWSSQAAARQQFMAAIAYADVVKLNLDEGAFLFGQCQAESMAQELIMRGVKLVCVSLGSQGSKFFTQKAEGQHSGFVIEPVDATGAGDAFLAGVCVFLSEHQGTIAAMTKADLDQMAAFANGCGALVASRLGAMDAHFTRMDVLALMAGS